MGSKLCLAQYVYNQQHAQIFVIRLYFQYTLYMFRTVSVHLQEQSFHKLNIVFGMCGYVWLLCCLLKIKSNDTNFVHLIGYIHIAR